MRKFVIALASVLAVACNGTVYQNCEAAREAGVAPLYSDDPGYGSHLDRDGDGIGCE